MEHQRQLTLSEAASFERTLAETERLQDDWKDRQRPRSKTVDWQRGLEMLRSASWEAANVARADAPGSAEAVLYPQDSVVIVGDMLGQCVP